MSQNDQPNIKTTVMLTDQFSSFVLCSKSRPIIFQTKQWFYSQGFPVYNSFPKQTALHKTPHATHR